jgi:hypothetical protein
MGRTRLRCCPDVYYGQHAKYTHRLKSNDLAGLRGNYVEEWTVFWITAHFLNAAAQFKEFGYLSPEAKSSASTIGLTCTFNMKIYKNIRRVLAISVCG